MKLDLKVLAVSAALAVSAVSAFAAPLDSLGGSVLGPVEFKYSGATTESNTQANTNETTWGIGNVTSITRPSGPPDFGANIFSSGEGGDFLTYMIYGIADLTTVPNGTNGFTIYNAGATGTGCGTMCGSIYLDIYRRNAAGAGTTPSSRDGYGQYDGITSPGDLYLRLEFVRGIVADDLGTGFDESLSTLVQDVTSETLPATGTGSFYANVVGGSAQGIFDTGLFTTAIGTQADFFGRFDLTIATGCESGQDCFQGLIRDPLTGNVQGVPEPATLALVGLALAGVAGISRRRRS